MAREHAGSCTKGPAAAFAGIVLGALRAAGGMARRALGRHQERRRAWETFEALRRLDDRTLRDIGYHRTDLSPAASRWHGDAS